MDIEGAKLYIKREIKRLSEDVSENITKQEVEDFFDTVKDSLNAALCRLDEDRWAE